MTSADSGSVPDIRGTGYCLGKGVKGIALLSNTVCVGRDMVGEQKENPPLLNGLARVLRVKKGKSETVFGGRTSGEENEENLKHPVDKQSKRWF